MNLPVDINQLVGLKMTDDLEAQLDMIPNVRIIEHGGIHTADLRMGRVNIHVDQNGIISRISHG